MADDYEIVSRIVIDDRASAASATKAAQKMGGAVEQQFERTGSRISSIFGKAFAFAGGIFGAKQIATGITGIHSEVENAEGSLATLISSLGKVSLPTAIPIAREQFRLLAADAAAGVGSTEDYTEAFTRLLGPARAAGAELERVRKLTKLGIAAGFAIGGQQGAKNLPGDIVQALSGGAGEIATKQLNIALGAIGMTTTQFNKLNKAARLDKLEEALAGFAAGAELMGQSWDAQSDTLRDGVKRIARTLTAPLFDRWKTSLMAANSWLEKNEERIQAIATDLGGTLATAWDQVISKASTYAAIVGGLALADHLPSLPGGPGRSRAGAKGGGGLLGRVRAMGAAPAGASAAAGGAFATGPQSALAFVGRFGASVARLAGPAILVTGLLAGVAGALQEWPALWGLLLSLGAELSISLGMVAESLGGLTESGSALNLVGMLAIGVLYGVGRALNVVVRGAALVVEGLGFVGVALGTLAKLAMASSAMIIGALTGDVGLVKQARADYKEWKQEGQAGLGQSVQRMRKILGLVPDAAGAGKEGEAAGALPGGAGALPEVPAGGNTYIGSVTVDAKSEINNDPARIAIGWSKVLTDLQRNPRATKRSASPLIG